jgi:hypothetical protein
MRKASGTKESRGGGAKGADVRAGVQADPAGNDAAAPASGGEVASVDIASVAVYRLPDGRWDFRAVSSRGEVVLANEGLEDFWACVEQLAAYWPGADHSSRP